MTGDLYLDLIPVSIISLVALDAGLKEPLRQTGRQTLLDVYGADGVIGAAKASFTYSAVNDTLDLDADFAGVTGEGWRVAAVAANTEWSTIPFEDAAATTYYIGARAMDVPSAASANTTDGSMYYAATRERIGVPGTPDTVTDLGGSIRMVVDTLVDPGWTAGATRQVIVWLNTPETASTAVAIQTVTAAYDGASGSVRITIPDNLGQTTVSTTPGDYSLFLLGPRITDTDITSDAKYVILGTQVGNGGASSNALQTLYPSWGTFLTAFGVEHHAGTGVHEVVTAQRVTIAGLAGDKLKATALDAADDAAQALVAVVSSTGVQTVGLWAGATKTKVQTQANTVADADTYAQVQVRNAGAAAMIELWARDGGVLRFPSAGLGAGPSIEAVSATDVTLVIGNPTAGKFLKIVHDGEMEWNSGSSGNAWRLLVNNAANQLLTVENLGAGLAGFYVKGPGRFEGDLTIDSGVVELATTTPTIKFLDSGGREVQRQIPLYYDIDVISGTPVRQIAGNPPTIYSSSVVTPLVYHIGLNKWMPFGQPSGLGHTGVSIVDWGFRYNRASGTGSITLNLYKVDKNALSARVLVKSLAATSTSGTWQIAQDFTGYTVSPDSHYYVEVVIDPNSGTNTDYKLLGMWVNWGTTHLVGST